MPKVSPLKRHSFVWTMGLSVAATVLCAASPLAALDPLACADPRVLRVIRENLQNTGRAAAPPRTVLELRDPREVSLGAPPRSANRYATAETFIAVSRYCEGQAVFDTGVAEPVYWRLDVRKEGSRESTRTDLCHKLFDQFEDGCKAFRPGG